ncbi:MAG: hypothetical protein QW052_05765 [Candidatus Nitrosocaldaceae archaeon]
MVAFYTGKGRCHICRKVTEVEYCTVCKHYLCRECEDNWVARGKEAVKELLYKFFKSDSDALKDRCCGPVN